MMPRTERHGWAEEPRWTARSITSAQIGAVCVLLAGAVLIAAAGWITWRNWL